MTEQTIFDALDRDERRSKPAEAPKVGEGWRLIPDVDLVAYYANKLTPQPAISNSGMAILLNETPLDFAYQDAAINPEPELIEKAKATAAQRRGDVVHQLALGKGRGYAIGEFNDWRTKAAQAFKEEADAQGLTPVLAHKFEEAEVMAAVLREKIERTLEGAAYETEVAVLWQEETQFGPVWCRGLLDVWCEDLGVILDPKVSAMLYNGKVEKHFLNMGWDRQAALYSHGVGKVLPHLAGRVSFADLMIKPEPPFTSRLVAPDKAWEYSSIKEAQRAIEIFAECLYSGRWKGFGDKVERISMPAWESKRREAVELGEGV